MGNHFYVPMLHAEDVIPHLAKGIDHWKPGYSAAELAQSWWNAQGIPEKISQILDRADEWKTRKYSRRFSSERPILALLGGGPVRPICLS